VLVGWLVCIGACSDDTAAMPATDDGAQSTAGDMDTPGDDSSTSGAGTGSDTTGEDPTGDDPTGPDSTGASGACGNGVVEADEACDDANDVGTDACSNLCTLNFEVAWTVSVDAGTGGFDLGTDVVVAPDGTVYAVGSWTPVGTRELWIAQFGADGSPGWTTSYAGEGSFAGAASVLLHPSGDLLVGGRVEAADEVSDPLLLRVSAVDGEILWTQTYDGPADDGDGEEVILSIALDDADDLVIAGGYESEEQESPFVAHVAAADGALTWMTDLGSLPGYEAEAVRALVQADGSIVVAVQRSGNGLPLRSELLTVSATGAIEDQHVVGPWAIEDLAIDPEGRLVGVGYIESDTFDILVVALDEVYEERWRSHVDGPAYAQDFGQALALDDHGDVVIAAQWGERGQARNAVVRRYDLEDGDVAWTSTYDNEEAHLDDRAWGIATGPDDAIVVVGFETVLGEQLNAWVRRLNAP